jgi:hypothetical protein
MNRHGTHNGGNPMENPNDTGRKRDVFEDLQARVERALDEIRPKVRRAFEELDATIDSALADVKPKVDARMKQAQPRVADFVNEVQPKLDAMLRRMEEKLADLRRDLEERAQRAEPADTTTSGVPTEPPTDSPTGTPMGGADATGEGAASKAPFDPSDPLNPSTGV